MTSFPAPARPLRVEVSLHPQLDAEAYAARIDREDRFAVSKTGERADVKLTDRCPAACGSVGPTPTVMLLRPGAVAGERVPCDCCRRLPATTTWAELLRTLANVVGVDDVVGTPRPANESSEAPDRLAGLTRREREVLGLVGQGKSVSECAASMGVAPSTVGNHKYRLMRKLQVSNSLQLLRIAVRNGLADFE